MAFAEASSRSHAWRAMIVLGAAFVAGCSLIYDPNRLLPDGSAPDSGAMCATACVAPTPYCDSASETCVECLAAANCDDGDPCTTDNCANGVCGHAPSANCGPMAVGSAHTCAVQSGSFYCWGLNSDGQLGDGTMTSSSSPVAIASVANVGGIVAGLGHTCIVRTDGSLACWGYNGTGAVGDGTQMNRPSPVEITTLSDVLQVGFSSSARHSCARQAGAVFCWGLNMDYQISGAAGSYALDPFRIDGVTATQVTTGEAHTCVLHNNGTVSCWGYNANGQLGNGTMDGGMDPANAPTVLGLTDAVHVVGGYDYTCALRATGSVVCWGSNANGELGDGTTDPATAPVPTATLTDVVEVRAGGTHVCARRATGGVACWGANDHGQLGDGTFVPSHTPVLVMGLTDAVQIGAGSGHTCARRATGAIVCWGNNTDGRLGNGSTQDSSTPVDVVFP